MPEEWRTQVRQALEARAPGLLDVACEGRIYSIMMAPVAGADYVNLYGRDVTERAQAETNLQVAEERFRVAAQSLSDVLYEWDIRSSVEWFGNIDGLLGYAPGEFPRTLEAWVDILHPEDRDRVWRAVDRQLRGEAPYDIEYRVRREDGGWRHWLARGTALRDASGTPYRWIGAITDVTDRKALEAERAQLEIQARHHQKLEAIGTLAGGVAHEINNPITGIMNYAQLIADAAAPGSRAAEYAGEIVRETERVATIVRNLLQFARHEKQAHSPARLADIIEQTLSLLRAVFRREQITLTMDVPEALPALNCRSQQIQQVLMNLLTNARDALNEKYPGHDADKTIRITVQRFEQAGRSWLRLTVADQGPGIPSEIQARIFDPFFTTKPRDKGTGLGLSISHGIVQDHHGRLHFETAPGTGTQFHLDLPVDNGWRMGKE